MEREYEQFPARGSEVNGPSLLFSRCANRGIYTTLQEEARYLPSRLSLRRASRETPPRPLADTFHRYYFGNCLRCNLKDRFLESARR